MKKWVILKDTRLPGRSAIVDLPDFIDKSKHHCEYDDDEKCVVVYDEDCVEIMRGFPCVWKSDEEIENEADNRHYFWALECLKNSPPPSPCVFYKLSLVPEKTPNYIKVLCRGKKWIIAYPNEYVRGCIDVKTMVKTRKWLDKNGAVQINV